MQTILIVISVVILSLGILSRQRFSNFSENEEESHQEEVLSEDVYVTQAPLVSDYEVITETPSPTSTPTVSGISLSQYKYPNSEIISTGSNSLSLKSNDSTDVITSWYKEKIKSENMNVKTFVTTKANDNILNKLVGVNFQNEVRVEIKKDGNSQVDISVILNP